MLPVNVASLKNVSPLAVVMQFLRAAGRYVRRPDASFFSVHHAVVKVLNVGECCACRAFPVHDQTCRVKQSIWH